MMPYGLKRRDTMPYPDRADVTKGGLPSKFGRAANKAKTRRSQKRAARRDGKATCSDQN